MKANVAGERVTGVAEPAQAEAASGAQRSRVRGLFQACRQALGIPDYDRYLEHMAARHPGEPVLSQREFFARSIDHKYGRSGPRCC